MGTSTGSGGAGAPAQLGGVFGAKASPYLGAVLKGITGGANFQQPQQSPRYLSGGFDPQGYMAKNPDVAQAVQSGAMPSAMYHYMNYGMNEGRAPNAWASSSGPNYLGSTLRGKFNDNSYSWANPDVAAAVQQGVFPEAWRHYMQYGLREGRSPTGFGLGTGTAPQWMAPRQTPPGISPQSAVMPSIQQVQPSQMPYLPQPMSSASPATSVAPGMVPGAAAGAQGQQYLPPDQLAFMNQYFPTWSSDSGTGTYVAGSG